MAHLRVTIRFHCFHFLVFRLFFSPFFPFFWYCLIASIGIRLYLSNVSSGVGAPWRCGVLTI